MRILASLTALAMAASAAAYADPPRTSNRDRTYDRDGDHGGNALSDRYDRYDRSRWSREFHGRWVQIARANAADGRHEYWLGAARGYRKLRIEGVRGAAEISKVAINFADGSTQIVNLNGPLSNGSGEVIDLAGDVRKVQRVIVYANPQSRGVYMVYGA